jgi:glutaredoxin 3
MVWESPGVSQPDAIVEIYTWRSCPFCLRAKTLLERKGIPFREYCIDGDESARREMARRANGRSSVPQIFINNVSIGGCDELHALERRGQLEAFVGGQG